MATTSDETPKPRAPRTRKPKATEVTTTEPETTASPIEVVEVDEAQLVEEPTPPAPPKKSTSKDKNPTQVRFIKGGLMKAGRIYQAGMLITDPELAKQTPEFQKEHYGDVFFEVVE